jgi:signal transduction histidine kinase
VENAVRYAAHGERVEVGVYPAGPGRARIAVRDFGDGVSEGEARRIFQRFAQGHAGAASGLGLGLYISHQIIELHGGRMAVEEPADGPGARFVVELPAPDLAAVPRADGGASTATGPPARVSGRMPGR